MFRFFAFATALQAKRADPDSFVIKKSQVDAGIELSRKTKSHFILADYDHEEGSLIIEGQVVGIDSSRFRFQSSEELRITASQQTLLSMSFFTSMSNSPALTLDRVKDAETAMCNFSEILRSGAIVALDSRLKIARCSFEKARAENGGAVYFDGPMLRVENAGARGCRARDSGGAFFFGSGSVGIVRAAFSENAARRGWSIFSRVVFVIQTASFSGSGPREIKGPYTGEDLAFSGLSQVAFLLVAAPTQTPSPVASRSPNATDLVGGGELVYSVMGVAVPGMLIVIIALIVLVLVASGVAIACLRASRPRNTIYAGQTDVKDENEMGTVEIKSTDRLSEIYQLPGPPIDQ
jgi:hypothetical protein